MITTVGRILGAGFFIGLMSSLGGGCEREVAGHCANLSGDASCRGYFGKTSSPRNFCSSCAGTFHGCVDTPPEAECWHKGEDPSEPPPDDTGTTGPEPMTSTGTDATADGDIPATGTDTDDTDDTEGSSSGPPQPVCGNGVVEADEACDTDDLAGQDCRMFGGGGGDSGGSGGSGDSGGAGELRCSDDCTLDPSMCAGFAECGDGVIQGAEECDEHDLNGQSCATLEDVRTGGNLSCAGCLFNTTNCCIPNGDFCSTNSDCCSGSCVGIANLLLKTCQ